MSAFDFGVDQLYAPIALDENNNQLRVSENGTANTITIPTGTYWNHLASSSYNPGSNQGLIAEITGQLTGSYSTTSITPDGGDGLPKSGIRWTNTNNNNFEFRFTHNDTTLDPRLMGFSGQEDVTSSAQSHNADDQIDSRFSLWATLMTHNFVEGRASMKDRTPLKKTKKSTDDMARARPQTLNKFDVRTVKYEYMYGAVIKENRADDEGSANLSSLPWFAASAFAGSGNSDYGDTHNAFESFWDLMTAPGRDEKVAELVFVHDEGDQGHDISQHSLEFVRFRGPKKGWDDPSELYSMRTTQGELYDLEMEFQITSAESYHQ